MHYEILVKSKNPLKQETDLCVFTIHVATVLSCCVIGLSLSHTHARTHPPTTQHTYNHNTHTRAHAHRRTHTHACTHTHARAHTHTQMLGKGEFYMLIWRKKLTKRIYNFFRKYASEYWCNVKECSQYDLVLMIYIYMECTHSIHLRYGGWQGYVRIKLVDCE